MTEITKIVINQTIETSIKVRNRAHLDEIRERIEKEMKIENGTVDVTLWLRSEDLDEMYPSGHRKKK